MLIRDARAGDAAAILAVTLAAYQEYATVIPSMWEGYRGNIVATLADAARAEQLVAERDGAVVGTVLLYPAGAVLFASGEGPSAPLPFPEVRLLAVDPAARGQGVGAALMRECLGRARRAGAAAITLHTTDMMRTAMAMYQRMGFVRAPELDFHPGPGLTVKGFRRALTD